MSTKKIDTLSFKRNSDATYKINGVCHTAGAIASPSQGTVIGGERRMEIDATQVSKDQQIVFGVDAVSFSGDDFDNPIDHLLLTFKESSLSPNVKGGVVIRDSKYPPPYAGVDLIDPHELFTAQFVVEKIDCTRIDQSDNFELHIKLSYSTVGVRYIEPYAVYSEDGYRGPLGHKVSAAVLGMKEIQEEGTHHEEICFTIDSMPMENKLLFDRSIPIVVCKDSIDNIGWKYFTKKKASLLIL